MQLTSFTDYALRCLMYLAAHSERLSTVKEISEFYNISHHHLVKVVHKLSQLGFIESCKGKSGGIRLSCNAQQLRLGDIIQKLESNLDLVECFNPLTNSCKISNICQLRHFLFEARGSFLNVLNKYTLADTLKNDSKVFFLKNGHYKQPANDLDD